MSHEPYMPGILSEESWAERQRPGGNICDCGRLVAPDERHQCACCDAPGCSQCMRTINDTGAEDLNNTWICDEVECAVGWLEELGQSAERTHADYQAWLGRRIEEERKRGADARAAGIAKQEESAQ